MSSHKEAPGIAQDPAADSTDVYAFVSPDNPSTVTILANYVPVQDPAGGPNFFEFGAKTQMAGGKPWGESVLYEIHIDNTGSGLADITYQFLFTTFIRNPNTFLYNTGPITVAGNGRYSSTWNRYQTYTVTRIDRKTGVKTPLRHGTSTNFASPPCNVGIRSTPNYQKLSAAAIHTTTDGIKIFAGQRAEGFFVDLGSIFDLAALRPLNANHLIPLKSTDGINALAGKNVHSIALQIPISQLTRDGSTPTGPSDPRAVIGVHTTASRQQARLFNQRTGLTTAHGPYRQVSRLGSPLVNEVVVPMSKKDYFNSQPPVNDAQFAAAVKRPEAVGLLVKLYPGAFPNLAAYNKDRADLVAIFVTGIPGSVIGPAFGAGTYQGGAVVAEKLRLNMAIKPTGADGTGTSDLGLLGNDLAGFPNGRRVTDDVVTIELKALAGATIPLVDPSYTPDAAVALVSQGVTKSARAYQKTFPYLADPHGGFSNPPSTPPSDPNPHQ